MDGILNSILNVVAGCVISAFVCWLFWIPKGIYGMVIRKMADKKKNGVFPYMQYFTWDEANNYALIVAITRVLKVTLALGVVDGISGLKYEGSFRIIVTVISVWIMLHFANKYRKKREAVLVERFGENSKYILKKMFTIGIGSWLWEIPVALTIVGLIVLFIVGCFASACAETPEESKARWEAREARRLNEFLDEQYRNR